MSGFVFYSGTPDRSIAVPDTMSNVPSTFRQRWLRPQDLVWLLLFSALALVSTDPTKQEIALVFGLGLFQVIEPEGHVVHDRSRRRRVHPYQAGALLPINRVHRRNQQHVLRNAPASCGFRRNDTEPSRYRVDYCARNRRICLVLVDARLVTVRIDEVCSGRTWDSGGLSPVVAFLTQQLAEANRVKAKKYQAAAEQLEAANRHLQEAEAQMRRSERLVALGQLTAGLAHELRNPLGTMRASAELLLKRVSAENDVARELAGFIASEVDRTNSLITRFLEFARPLQLRRESTDLTLVLDEAIRELERHHPRFKLRFTGTMRPRCRRSRSTVN